MPYKLLYIPLFLFLITGLYNTVYQIGWGDPDSVMFAAFTWGVVVLTLPISYGIVRLIKAFLHYSPRN